MIIRIYLVMSNNITLQSLNCSKNTIGVYFHTNEYNKMTDSYCSGNSDKGIYVFNSLFNQILNNNVSTNLNGIYLQNSSSNLVRNNTGVNNTVGIYLIIAELNNISRNFFSNSLNILYFLNSISFTNLTAKFAMLLKISLSLSELKVISGFILFRFFLM